MELLQAYADGVNAYIANNPLPIEYGRLELTTVRPWDPIDSLVIGKAIAANLSLDIDIEPTLQLNEYVTKLGPAQGSALFFEDVRRLAPMDPASTVPDATGDTPFLAKKVKVNRVRLARAAAGPRGSASRPWRAPPPRDHGSAADRRHRAPVPRRGPHRRPRRRPHLQQLDRALQLLPGHQFHPLDRRRRHLERAGAGQRRRDRKSVV